MIGATPEETVVMNTLSINLHLLLASFYKPTDRRNKIILEWKPFPSDHYIIESQIAWHGYDPQQAMIKIEPDCESGGSSAPRKFSELSNRVQYYSGQLFDIPTITAYAKSRGIMVGWDLAHAVGNVELKLHDWDVDFASWCNYKYINAGPGAIAGAFIHEKYGTVEYSAKPDQPTRYWPRLTGWYGGDKSVRFDMSNVFIPAPGAAGYQASNPSAIDLASLSGALSVFEKTSMSQLRSKSLVMTAYAEYLLDEISSKFTSDSNGGGTKIPPFRIITPRDPLQRGAQLSVLLRDEGLVDSVANVWVKSGNYVEGLLRGTKSSDDSCEEASHLTSFLPHKIMAAR
ncbi:Kynureninase (L-kynurenine hydrolase) [Lecanicillium sp. MT-2017a]|nr:Kynureninase (L-kynurenine hydrolase) [Lecanicillium sp. MT-2017a]